MKTQSSDYPDRATSTLSLLDAPLTPFTVDELLDEFRKTIRLDKKAVFANLNLHGLYLYHHEPEMREMIGRSDYVFIDGVPLVWLARLFGFPLTTSHRTTPIDFIYPLLEDALSEEWRVYFLGSKPNVGDIGATRLKKRFPGLLVRVSHGYFDPRVRSHENLRVIRDINDFRPNILIVGLGMPRQERWVLQNIEALDTNVILCAGGLMDLVAGVLPTPPRWISGFGFEWVYRLANHPRRVWKRYLVEPWFIVRLALSSLLRKRLGARDGTLGRKLLR